MATRTALAIGIAILAGAVPAKAAAQDPYSFAARPAWTRALCEAMNTATVTAEDRQYRNIFQEILWKAAGIPLGTPAEAAKQRVAAFSRAQAALPFDRSGLNCSGISLLYRGNLMDYAVDGLMFNNLRRLSDLGFDLNIRNPTTGETMLDHLAKQVDGNWRSDETTGSPAGRFNGFRGLSLSTASRYWQFRKLGALHASETARSRASCAATAADAPGAGVPFTGEMMTTGTTDLPASIPGVTTISARQAACMLDDGDDVVAFAALREREAIPGSYGVPWAAKPGTYDDEVQRIVGLEFSTLTGMRKDRPIIVYCHHERCALSYNVLLRAKAAGYSKLFWLREGLAAWKSEGYPTGAIWQTMKDTPFDKELKP